MWQLALYVLVLLALTKPMGLYMETVFDGRRTWLHPPLRPLEKLLYRLFGVDENTEQHWTRYAGALLAFSVVGMLFTYILLRVQQWLPLNPQGLGNVGAHLSFNTAASFTTNTNWQSYTPETTMSYLTEMVGLATHNFFSAAAGIAIAIALVRGFARHSAKTIGNFWVDVTRATLYVLLPLSRRGRPAAVLAGRDSEFPSLHEGRRRSKARCRPSRRGRWLRRKPSRCSAPTAADSSTPTRRIPSRTPRRFPTSCRCS